MNSILIIDDESDVRDGVKRVLERAGFSVRAVESADDAMQELERAAADVVITDIIMPKINGVDAINTIRRRFPSTLIMAISGGGSFDVAGNQPGHLTTNTHLAAAQKAGAHRVLAKPFESRELIQAVRSLIAIAPQ